MILQGRILLLSVGFIYNVVQRKHFVIINDVLHIFIFMGILLLSIMFVKVSYVCGISEALILNLERESQTKKVITTLLCI